MVKHMKKGKKLNRETASKKFEHHRWNCWPLPFEFLARLLQGHRALAGGGFDLRKFQVMWLEAIMEEERVERTKTKTSSPCFQKRLKKSLADQALLSPSRFPKT